MKVKNLNMLKKGDIILILTALIVNVLIYALNSNYIIDTPQEKIAVIKQNGKVIREINLNKVTNPFLVNISRDKVVLKVEKGSIKFLSSECTNKVCIKAGCLSHKGERAVCVPFRTEVLIKDTDQPDSIAY